MQAVGKGGGKKETDIEQSLNEKENVANNKQMVQRRREAGGTVLCVYLYLCV